METKQGKTALMMATLTSSLQAITALCACGANMDYESAEEKTALFWAVEMSRLDSLAALVKKGVEVDYLNG